MMKLRFNAPVTLSLSIMCLAVYVLTLFVPPLYSWVALAIPTWASVHLFNVPTLVTHILGHASWEHLLGNLTLFLLAAPACEERFGSVTFFFMIVLTAAATAALQITLFNEGLIGLSGIVFMCILASSATNIRQGEVPLTLVLVAAVYMGRELAEGFRADNVSQFAHLFGGVCGIVFGLLRPSMRHKAT